MATQKPISTISYNSKEFLHEKLETWRTAHIIQAYMFIWHKGEDGDKDHIHLRIEPNKKLDQMDLTEDLKEFDPTHPDLPLCVRPWTPSKEPDWVLYGVHDKEYMELKYPYATKEKIPYPWTDIVASEGFDVEVAYIRAKASMLHTQGNLTQQLKTGKNPIDLVMGGENVFVVNALMRTINNHEWQDMINYQNELKKENAELFHLITQLGYNITKTDDGRLVVSDKVTGLVLYDNKENLNND